MGSLAEIDEAPALRLDWLLAIDEIVHEAEAEQQKKAARDMRRQMG